MSFLMKQLPPLKLDSVRMGVKAELKNWFFDRDQIVRLLDKRTFGVLGHFGGFVRKWALNSIKSKPYGAISKPGQPPYDHMGYSHKLANKRRRAAGLPTEKQGGFKGIKHIYYGLDRVRRSVVIGPLASSGKSDVLPALEYGGTSRVFTGTRRRRKVEKVVHIRPHPFMQPAFEGGKKELPKFWAQAKD